jgi:hypothetical protein
MPQCWSSLEALHCTDVGNTADVSEIHTTSIFRNVVCRVNDCSCTHRFWSNKLTGEVEPKPIYTWTLIQHTSSLKMEAERASETSATFPISTRCKDTRGESTLKKICLWYLYFRLIVYTNIINTGKKLMRPAGFNPRSSHVWLVVYKAALGQVFPRYFDFPCSHSTNRSIFINHLIIDTDTDNVVKHQI